MNWESKFYIIFEWIFPFSCITTSACCLSLASSWRRCSSLSFAEPDDAVTAVGCSSRSRQTPTPSCRRASGRKWFADTALTVPKGSSSSTGSPPCDGINPPTELSRIEHLSRPVESPMVVIMLKWKLSTELSSGLERLLMCQELLRFKKA